MKTTDHTAFLELYEPIHSSLTRYCRALAGNVEDAEDLMQDVLLHGMEKFDAIRDKSALKAYMFSVAGNLLKKKLRRKKFRAEFNSQEIDAICDHGQDPEYITDFKIVYEKMLALGTKTAETLVLFHIADLSLEEIRKIQGGSLSGVKLRLKRGREKLLSQLKQPAQVRIALMLFSF